MLDLAYGRYDDVREARQRVRPFARGNLSCFQTRWGALRWRVSADVTERAARLPAGAITLLLVEDDDRIRTALALALADAGFPRGTGTDG